MIKRLIVKLLIIFGNEFESQMLRKAVRSWFGIEVGLYSYGCFDPSRIPRNTKIGRYCSFAASCSFFPRNHGLHYISLHPFLYNSALNVVEADTIERTDFVVEDDVWIGHNVTITSKAAVIGRGAVIAANSVVTESVPRYAVVAGVPGKVIKYRFPDEIIERIEESEWWKNDKVSMSKGASQTPQMYYCPSEYYAPKD